MNRTEGKEADDDDDQKKTKLQKQKHKPIDKRTREGINPSKALNNYYNHVEHKQSIGSQVGISTSRSRIIYSKLPPSVDHVVMNRVE